jgi:hypothetical protein
MSNTEQEETDRMSLRSNSLSSIYGRPVKSGHVGIEVEVEFEENTSIMTQGVGPWLAKEDGSLRHGMEYISRAPFKVGSTLKDKVVALTNELAKFKVVTNSPRTSVHNHVNVLDKTPVEILTAACAYWLVEQPLVQFCGPETRVRNHFCLRLVDAEGMYKRLLYDLTGSKGTVFASINADTMKYSALNLACLRTLGTLEFRSMRGSVDPDLITLWATGCYELVERATKNFKDPKELMDAFWASSKDQLLPSIVGPELQAIIVNTPGYIKQMRESAEVVSLLAYGIDGEWSEWQDRRCKPAEKTMKPKSASSILQGLTGSGLNVSPYYLNTTSIVVDDYLED